MSLTPKAPKIPRPMTRERGTPKGRRVFYTSVNKGVITGVEVEPRPKPSRRRTPG